MGEDKRSFTTDFHTEPFMLSFHHTVEKVITCRTSLFRRYQSHNSERNKRHSWIAAMASIGDTCQVYNYLPMMVTKLRIVLALFTFYDWFPMLTAEQEAVCTAANCPIVFTQQSSWFPRLSSIAYTYLSLAISPHPNRESLGTRLTLACHHWCTPGFPME